MLGYMQIHTFANTILLKYNKAQLSYYTCTVLIIQYILSLCRCFYINKGQKFFPHHSLTYQHKKPTDLPEVDDEAVSLVEAGPGHVHLGGSDGPATLDVKQALHAHVIGQHMLEARCYTSFL